MTREIAHVLEDDGWVFSGIIDEGSWRKIEEMKIKAGCSARAVISIPSDEEGKREVYIITDRSYERDFLRVEGWRLVELVYSDSQSDDERAKKILSKLHDSPILLISSSRYPGKIKEAYAF